MYLELAIILQIQKNEYNINADKLLTKYIEAMYVCETEENKPAKVYLWKKISKIFEMNKIIFSIHKIQLI